LAQSIYGPFDIPVGGLRDDLPSEVLEGHFFKALDELAPIAEGAGVELLVENIKFPQKPIIYVRF
jgi:hypothetical protein